MHSAVGMRPDIPSYGALGGLSKLLLSYNRRLWMISEALELRVKGGRVNHSWCMSVVRHGNCGFGGDRNGGGGWYACGTKPKMLVVCRRIQEHYRVRCNKLMTLDHTTV